MAPKIIRISRFFVKRYIGLNLQLWQEFKRKSNWLDIHADRYSIQFDPVTERYEEVLFNGTKGDYIGLKSGWKVFMIPQPMSEYELHATDEAITAGAHPFMSGDDNYVGEVVVP